MSRVLEESERKVLGEFRRLGQASKADIARRVQLTHPAVAQIVKKLCEMRYLDEHKEKRKGGRGQPATIYSISERNIFVGIHVGRRRLEFVALTLNGTVIASSGSNFGFLNEKKLKSKASGDLHLFLSDRELKGKFILGIGISTPYFWSGWQSILPAEGEMSPDWHWETVSSLFDFSSVMPVLVENDGSSAALAELTFGAGCEHGDFLYVNIGTFIGGGLIIDGTLRTGAHGNSAALGPFPVAHSTLTPRRSATGPFELLLGRASLHALKQHAQRCGVGTDLSDWKTPRSRKFTAVVDEWVDDCGKALAQFVIGVWSLIDIEAIVVDGALPKDVLERIVESTRNQINEYEIEGIIPSEIKLGALGAMAQSIGAACLPILKFLGPPQIRGVDGARPSNWPRS